MTEIADAQVTAYDVSGATLADVAAAISHLPEAGSCSWHPAYTYETDEHGHITSAVVNVGFDIQLPQWTDYSSASQAAKDEWDRWWAALEAHENGHRDIAINVFWDLETQMIGKTGHEAQTIFDHAVAEAQRKSDEYDSTTNHGINTGTVMDTSIP